MSKSASSMMTRATKRVKSAKPSTVATAVAGAVALTAAAGAMIARARKN
jgi:hypothetical protein